MKTRILLILLLVSILSANAYYPYSPYVYCIGNPISYVDPNGMDVAVLLVDGNPFGHLAILIQNDEGKWLYYSINGVESSSGVSDRNDVAIEGNWNSPQEFLRMTNRTSGDNDAKSNISGGIGLTPLQAYLPASPQFGGYGPTIDTGIKVIFPQPHAAFNAIMKANKGIYFSE